MSQLLVEIFCEEIPAGMVRPALAALAKGVLGLLDGIEHDKAVRTYATPRRLAVVVDSVAAGSPKVEKTVLGPPEKSAFKDGQPTKVAIGFARGKGVAVDDLVIVDGPRGRVVSATVTTGGDATTERIASGLDVVVRGLPFKKSMEWGSGGVRFARPLHRINAVYAGEAVQGTAAAIELGAQTEGHRLADDTVFAFTDETTWLAGLRARHVEPDLELRKARVKELVVEGKAAVDGHPFVDDRLLEEVTHLVEAPTLVRGAFDAELLALPPRLLIKAMKAHQRYFPVFQGDGLTEHFVVISNNPFGDHDRIATGNANVLRARFHDAKFFFAEDKKKSLEQHGEQLDKMRWIKGLGTVAQKQLRVAHLAKKLAPMFDAHPEHAFRAGVLAKCDLATLMVGEFGDLQGHMGMLYAAAQGEDEAVYNAIEEHYLPMSAGGAVARSAEGRTLAVADRLDTLVGCFAVGMVPKGSGDPQGLRRSVLGILSSLGNVRTPLDELFLLAAEHFKAHMVVDDVAENAQQAVSEPSALVSTLVEFARTRWKSQTCKQEGLSGDIVDALLAVGAQDPRDWSLRLEGLVAASKRGDFKSIMHTFKRVLNITEGAGDALPDAAVLTEDAERALLSALSASSFEVDGHVLAGRYTDAFETALGLAEPVSAFFDAVMVEDEDASKRSARKGILLGVSKLFLRLADFSRISTR